MLEIKHLTKSFDQFLALDHLDWQVPDGQILGLIGSNGAGKSTLLRCISSVYEYDGTVEWDGEPITKHQEKLFFVSDEPFYFSRFNTLQMKDFYKSFYKTFSEEEYQSLLKVFHFDDKKPIHLLSKGLKRQCALILALSVSPRLLLMDESFDGLDPMMRLHLKRELIKRVSEQGISVVISSHNIRELEDICDGLALLENKKIHFTKTLDELGMTYHKVQLGYAEAPHPDLFEQMPLLSYELNNKIVTVVYQGEEAEEFIKQSSPILINPLKISMEEIFVTEMEAQSHV